MTIEALTQKLHLTLNAMQTAVCDELLQHTDNLMVLSPTGSGKTLAYLLPLTQLLDAQSNQVQAVVVVPGRELALQSATVLKDMGCGLRGMACYGGRATMDEHRKLREVQPQIVFATPGRLNDHLQKSNIDTHTIRYLFIDEFDKCLEMGFHDEMQQLIGLLPKAIRSVLLSATPAEELGSQTLVTRFFKVLNFLPEDEQVSQRVTIYRVQSEEKDKLPTLRQLLLSFQGASTIVFLNYRDAVERVATYLREQGFAVSHFHGGMEQRQREDALYRFSNGSASILVSTDLAARGLDIPNIANIVHYHLPETEDGYVHRVGRTARWDKHGKAFFILHGQEQIPAYVDADVADFALPQVLPEPTQPRFQTLYIGKGRRDKLSKTDIVGFLCKKGGLKGDEIGRIDVRDRYTYVAVARTKAKQVVQRTQGEKIKGLRTVIEEVR
ncbi:DEAD/DEAH box helicase [Segatella oulorum]|uniref:DEAD/DEAH box helicase n=1 Tax=Segatella oulorum TaxID=28136 RepID=UPI0028F03F89|nr:DEAD/DEAH box helicase [Segatella oulorum]